jgi:peroxiredoxin Q/BCP
MDIGDRAPLFSLPDQDGVVFSLEAALGKGPIVVFFYPKDETAGCTAEACSFRDATPEFAAAGATILGISSDDVASHKRFAEHHHLPYRLLADVGGKVRAAFGLKRALFGLSDARVTFVLDPAGIIRHRYEATIMVHGHITNALATIRQLAAGAA